MNIKQATKIYDLVEYSGENWKGITTVEKIDNEVEKNSIVCLFNYKNKGKYKGQIAHDRPIVFYKKEGNNYIAKCSYTDQTGWINLETGKKFPNSKPQKRTHYIRNSLGIEKISGKCEGATEKIEDLFQSMDLLEFADGTKKLFKDAPRVYQDGKWNFIHPYRVAKLHISDRLGNYYCVAEDKNGKGLKLCTRKEQ